SGSGTPRRAPAQRSRWRWRPSCNGSCSAPRTRPPRSRLRSRASPPGSATPTDPYDPRMGRGALTLFHLRGIRVGVDYSWFLVLFLVIFWLSGLFETALGVDDSSSTPYVLAVASALAFF